MGGSLSKPTYTLKKGKHKKFLCPTRLLFSSDGYNFLWNDEGRYIESEFTLPSSANYVDHIECAHEYSSEYVLTYGKKYALLKLSDPEKQTIVPLDQHPHFGDGHRKEREDKCNTKLFSRDKSIELEQEDIRHRPMIQYFQGHAFTPDRMVLMTDHKTKQKIKLEDVQFVYSLQGGVHAQDNSSRAVMIASEWTYKSNQTNPVFCHTARKINDSGILPSHSRLKIKGAYNSFISTFLYDGRFVIVGRNRKYQEDFHKLFVAFWAPHKSHCSKKEKVFPFFVYGPFGEIAYCWQLPSTPADVLECQDVLTRWTNFPKVVVELITSYVCLSVLCLNREPHKSFSWNVVSKF